MLIPNNFINDYQYWQLITFPYQHLGISHLLFALIAFIPLSCEFEKYLGTLRYIFFFLLMNMIIGILYSITLFFTSYLKYKIFQYSLIYPCSGLWPIIIVFIIDIFNINPEAPTNFIFFPFEIKSKYYPWVFLIFYSVFFGYYFEIIFGFIVGYLSNLYLDYFNIFKYAMIPLTFAERIETSCLKSIGKEIGYIMTTEVTERNYNIFREVKSSELELRQL